MKLQSLFKIDFFSIDLYFYFWLKYLNCSFFISSSYEGWDNPFQPEGEISRDADELLRLWKEGKLKGAGLNGVIPSSPDPPPSSNTGLPDPSDETAKTPLLTDTNTAMVTFSNNSYKCLIFKSFTERPL